MLQEAAASSYDRWKVHRVYWTDHHSHVTYNCRLSLELADHRTIFWVKDEKFGLDRSLKQLLSWSTERFPVDHMPRLTRQDWSVNIRQRSQIDPNSIIKNISYWRYIRYVHAISTWVLILTSIQSMPTCGILYRLLTYSCFLQLYSSQWIQLVQLSTKHK